MGVRVLVVVMVVLLEELDNMAYPCLLHSTVPSESMRDQSGHLVICSHFSCYCHRYLVNVNVNMSDITTHVLLT